jgi:hypothetical protein
VHQRVSASLPTALVSSAAPEGPPGRRRRTITTSTRNGSRAS